MRSCARGDDGRSAMMLSPEISAAADIRVLSVGSVQIATKLIAPEFEKSTGHKVRVHHCLARPDRGRARESALSTC